MPWPLAGLHSLACTPLLVARLFAARQHDAAPRVSRLLQLILLSVPLPKQASDVWPSLASVLETVHPTALPSSCLLGFTLAALTWPALRACLNGYTRTRLPPSCSAGRVANHRLLVIILHCSCCTPHGSACCWNTLVACVGATGSHGSGQCWHTHHEHGCRDQLRCCESRPPHFACRVLRSVHACAAKLVIRRLFIQCSCNTTRCSLHQAGCLLTQTAGTAPASASHRPAQSPVAGRHSWLLLPPRWQTTTGCSCR